MLGCWSGRTAEELVKSRWWAAEPQQPSARRRSRFAFVRMVTGDEPDAVGPPEIDLEGGFFEMCMFSLPHSFEIST